MRYITYSSCCCSGKNRQRFCDRRFNVVQLIPLKKSGELSRGHIVTKKNHFQIKTEKSAPNFKNEYRKHQSLIIIQSFSLFYVAVLWQPLWKHQLSNLRLAFPQYPGPICCCSELLVLFKLLWLWSSLHGPQKTLYSPLWQLISWLHDLQKSFMIIIGAY